MTLTRRKLDRIASKVFLGLCLAIACTVLPALSPMVRMVRGAFTSGRDIRIPDPAAAVREARTLVADRARHPEKYGDFAEPQSLPAALRITGLRYAKIHDDHVDLVLARNPDWSVGARIWTEPHRRHQDQPTKYAGVYFFRYTHELPPSPENVP